MSEHETLRLHTIPSAYIDYLGNRSYIPFQRLVGVETVDEQLWAPNDNHFTAKYNRELTDVAEISSPPWFAIRLTRFYKEHLMGPKIKNRDYNCHTFGRRIAEDTLSNETYAALDVVEDGQKVSPPLPVGVRAVIGRAAILTLSDEARAPHSLVGLGEDNPNCLQIMCMDGYMGITKYDDILKKYAQGLGPVELFVNPAELPTAA